MINAHDVAFLPVQYCCDKHTVLKAELPVRMGHSSTMSNV